MFFFYVTMLRYITMLRSQTSRLSPLSAHLYSSPSLFLFSFCLRGSLVRVYASTLMLRVDKPTGLRTGYHYHRGHLSPLLTLTPGTEGMRWGRTPQWRRSEGIQWREWIAVGHLTGREWSMERMRHGDGMKILKGVERLKHCAVAPTCRPDYRSDSLPDSAPLTTSNPRLSPRRGPRRLCSISTFDCWLLLFCLLTGWLRVRCCTGVLWRRGAPVIVTVPATATVTVTVLFSFLSFPCSCCGR